MPVVVASIVTDAFPPITTSLCPLPVDSFALIAQTLSLLSAFSINLPPLSDVIVTLPIPPVDVW